MWEEKYMCKLSRCYNGVIYIYIQEMNLKFVFENVD